MEWDVEDEDQDEVKRKKVQGESGHRAQQAAVDS